MSPEQQAARWLADVPEIKKGLSDDVSGLGRFRHHPNPAIDFCIEVETLQSRLFDAKGSLSKPGTEPETVVSVLADIQKAMDFRVGGDEGAVNAKRLLRELEADALAAIARHLAPVDDLAEVEKVRDWLDKCAEHGGARAYRNAADTITALLARISALTAAAAEKQKLAEEATAQLVLKHSRTVAAEQENATLRDRLARMEGAGDDWDALMSDARAEAEKAMRKFPQPNYVISKIAEEAGEVVKAAIHCAEGRETADNLRGEMKQTLAMLYRLWVEGDQVHGLPPVRAALTDGGSE